MKHFARAALFSLLITYITYRKKTTDVADVKQQTVFLMLSETLKARERIPHKLDISYGTSDSQKYDLYGTDLPNNAQIVFWIHGGYWQEGSKEISATFVRSLHANGIKTVVVGYTLAPLATVRQIQKEIFCALEKVMQEYSEATFIVGGHSAGAQLAASLLHENLSEYGNIHAKRILGFLLFSGVYDLRPLITTYINQALKLTLNESEQLSLLLQPFQFPKRSVPIMICVGGFDSPEFQRQSQAYATKLRDAMFKNVQFRIHAEDDHFTLVERLSFSSKPSSATHVINFLTTMTSIN